MEWIIVKTNKEAEQRTLSTPHMTQSMLETVMACVSLCVEYEVTCSGALIYHVIMDTLIACILIKNKLFISYF